MNFPANFTAILDACVLYPAPIRDLLLNLAALDVFQPKWSDQIQEEWSRNLLRNRPDLSDKQLKKTIQAMNQAFPDANVIDFEPTIDTLTLPDKDDRHVLAAAIEANAHFIITDNIKDFPNEYLTKFGITPCTPDDFITNLFNIFPSATKQAFLNQVSSLRNPPIPIEKVLDNLKSCGLIKTSRLLSSII
ncbi:PIN domain-containing protein [Flexithrix dorotheae]|uniref:PIN domain-containing protein n=1 Tax=Flexithrix dorotheae TaxID=70993 RepID=UPI00035D9041|nr:PIN domain-containing protein [Flexithrix dorotheae]